MSRLRLGPLGIRFAAAFVGVALAAVAVFAVAVLIADQGNVARLASTDKMRTTDAVVALAENSYRSNGGWPGADLRPVSAFAQESGVALDLRDQAGRVLLSVSPPGLTPRSHPSTIEQAVAAGSGQVGMVRVAFPAGGLNSGDRHLRAALRARSAGVLLWRSWELSS